MDVLSLNPGSSSLRFQVVRVGSTGSIRLGGGSIASIGSRATLRARTADESPRIEPVEANDHVEALERAIDWTAARALRFEAVGVRVVHVGGDIGEARRVDDGLLEALHELAALAPLHTVEALAILARLRTRLAPAVPVVAVSDSAFHATLPPVAREYALPRRWTEGLGVRRFGYHGLAVRSVVEQLAARGQLARRIVVAHLGNGCSVSAVRDGRSIDTSMGFSPLEGLVMATRAGSVDPSIVARMCKTLGKTPDEIVRELNQRSGLLAVSGQSGDMREIEELRARGDAAAARAFDLFAYRARAHIAAAMAAAAGCDVLAFSGGIGENSPAVRAAVVADMEWCGIALDPARNSSPESERDRISRDGSPVSVHVVGADEEAVVARSTRDFLTTARADQG